MKRIEGRFTTQAALRRKARQQERLNQQQEHLNQLMLDGQEMSFSEEEIRISAALKVGFIHSSLSERDNNLYPKTRFKATNQAVQDPDKSIIVQIEGQLCAVSKAQFIAHNFKEVFLKLVNNSWVADVA